jgi:ElaB/YqjD/DUF883 family membrane-anchored ribosome-binding protein
MRHGILSSSSPRASLLERLRALRIAGTSCAAAMLVAAAPASAQIGVGGPGVGGQGLGSSAAPIIGPAIINAPPIRTAAPLDPTSPAAGKPVPASATDDESSGTFIADVSGDVQPDFNNLTTELRAAIDGTEGNVREKLIQINDRVAAISSDLVERAKETKQQARKRLDDVRKDFDKIHNELTTLADNAAADAKPKITAARDRVDTLRDNMQSATESRFRKLFDRVQDRAQTAAERIANRVEKAADRAENLAAATTERAGAIGAAAQRRAHDEISQLETDLGNLMVSVNENVRARLESVDERLTTVRNDLKARQHETAEAAATRMSGVRARLQEVRTDLSDIASNAGDEAKDRVTELHDRVGRIHDRLNVAEVSAIVRDKVGEAREHVAGFRGALPNPVPSSAPGAEADVHQQGKLGVTVRQGTTALTITSVAAGSAAAKAGLQVGDQLLAVDRRRVITHFQLVNELDAAAQNDGKALLMIRRRGRTQELQADLSQATQAQPANTQPTNSPPQANQR